MKAPTFAKKIGRRRKSEEEEFNSERLQVDEDKESPTSIDTEAYDKFSSEDDDAFDDDKFSSEEDFFDDAASLSSTQDLAVMIEMTSKFHVLKLNEEGRLHCDVFGALNPAGSVIARSRSASINEGLIFLLEEEIVLEVAKPKHIGTARLRQRQTLISAC